MPHLIGERIRLREYRREDLLSMRRWVNDPLITCHLSDTFLYPQTIQDTEAFIEGVIEGGDTHRGFIIAHRDTEDYIGQIDLFELDWKNRTAELGIVIGNRVNQGKGYGTEAVRLLIQFALHSMNLNRIQLEVNEDNGSAIRCYEKCGFAHEGRLRQRIYRNGRYHDLLIMAVLRDEYEQRQVQQA
ncbi:GNAT family N-acetyltransferase [Paenibacillus sp. SYP-B4298]|uniref:GNAT family N-acetyltransferase n=1 Tax=Paenibacillus sp. SYP-B4298 TaxID=2996034 RepID=UPI0022DE09D4|nr:GNAT family protein [Paenibacillus sp. SYP-B4298]